MGAAEIMTKGRRSRQVEARSLLSYFAVNELGMGITELARVFGMTPLFSMHFIQKRRLTHR